MKEWMKGVRGKRMVELPTEQWPTMPQLETEALRVWVSADYLAVLYRQRLDGNVRLTINSVRRSAYRNRRDKGGIDWRDGITWDELQRVKNECLGPDVWCVEVYPAQDAVVDVANMRHLWVLDGPPATRFPEKKVVSDDDVEAALRIFRAMLGGMP
jgi:hypothetical protein